jgi:hypothetical protein
VLNPTFVLRFPPLRQAAKRCRQFVDTASQHKVTPKQFSRPAKMQDRPYRQNLSLLCFLTIFISSTFLSSCSSRLLSGRYQGMELISVSSDNRYWPGVFKPDTNFDTANRQWYHKVTIAVKGKKAVIKKEPLYIKNDSTYFSKTDGGFYYYSGDIDFDKHGKTFKIFGSLDSCVFCPRLATATPLYSYESYYIKKDGRNWIVNTNYQKNLTFRKQ